MFGKLTRTQAANLTKMLKKCIIEIVDGKESDRLWI